MRTYLRQLLVALVLTLTSVSLFSTRAYGQDIPERPSPPCLVNDLAGIITAPERRFLEDTLVHFDRYTSVQITIVTINDLGGYDPSDFAQQLGRKWGVGQKGTNNGIVILVKPKTADSQGRAFISTGYGAEGALPDVLCTRIVNEDMIPFFQRNDYGGGIRAGAIKVMRAIMNEYTATDEYRDRYGEYDDVHPELIPMVIVLFGIVIFLLMSSRSRKGRKRGLTSDSDLGWRLLDIFLSGWSSGPSDWGSFSGGRGGRGDFGGFGGFGGGDFGGGGGGGRW